MNTACVILAAGLGKRMNSSLPKVLHKICGMPMLQHVINAAQRLRPEKNIVVVGQHSERIKKEIPEARLFFVRQEEPKGTGDALMSAASALRGFNGTVLVLNGDTPLITVKTLKKFIACSAKNEDALSILSFIAEDPSAYGRILRDNSGKALGIAEDKDASYEQRQIREVNSGFYAISSACMELLKKIRLNKAKGEYYLTDLLGIAADRNLKTGVYCIGSEAELMGVNNRRDLFRAECLMQAKIINNLVDKGVNFIDTASVYIQPEVKIGQDTTIYPNVYLEGHTKIGSGCIIYPNVRIMDSIIGDNAAIKDSSVIEDSEVRHKAQIGPFAHIRPGSLIGSAAKIGNFVEIKKTVIGDRAKASHLSYIGDASVGKDVNIGAGTITCNYDGQKKHKTVISDKVFIGSDTQLIAPVKIGRGAYVGAGSTITRDVPPEALAISRVRQENIEGWAIKKQALGKGSKALVQKIEKGEKVK